MTKLQSRLFALQDKEYRDFHARLIPTIPRETIIGIRIPVLRKFALQYSKEPSAIKFLKQLPHTYYEENALHMMLIRQMKDFPSSIGALEAFLPYVDNWAVCDQPNPKSFAKNRDSLLPYIRRWLNSEQPYTIRYAIGVLMAQFLDESFSSDYLKWVAAVRSEEYYVNMMIAWYFATALAKQWNAALPYLTEQRLSLWCHNKTIQKALESYRISPEQKMLLRTLKLKKQ